MDNFPPFEGNPLDPADVGVWLAGFVEADWTADVAKLKLLIALAGGSSERMLGLLQDTFSSRNEINLSDWGMAFESARSYIERLGPIPQTVPPHDAGDTKGSPGGFLRVLLDRL